MEKATTRNIRHIDVYGGVDEGELNYYESISEEGEFSSFDSLPTELLIIIFQMLGDKDKANLSIVNKRFFSIFILFVGWNKICLFYYSNIKPIKQLKSSSLPKLEEKTISTNIQRFPTKKYVNEIAFTRDYANTSNSPSYVDIIFAFHPTEYETEITNEKIIPLDRTLSSNKRIIAAFFISPKFDHDFDFHYLIERMMVGRRYSTISSKEKRIPIGRVDGLDPSDHFITFQVTLSPDKKIEFKGLFDLRQFAREWSEKSEAMLTPTIKELIMLITVIKSFYFAASLKWNSPSTFMKKIEDEVGEVEYSFPTIMKAPGYPLLNFYLNVHPSKKEFISSDNFDLVLNAEEYHFSSHPSHFDTFSVRGGIYADEMGLGKTITMISLILTNPRKADDKGKYETVIGKRIKGLFESKSTLIICPSQLVYQWEKEITTNSPDLKVIVIAQYEDLQQYKYEDILLSDIVITSHQFLKNKKYMQKVGEMTTLHARIERNRSKALETAKLGNLQSIGWHRIVLDEGHEVLSSSSGGLACTKLFRTFLSNYRWYVTGTPVPRGRDSLAGALNFLDIKLSSNTKLPDRITNQTLSYELCLFNAAKKILFWRNTKSSISHQVYFPKLKESVSYISLSENEKCLYDCALLDNNLRVMREICTMPMECEYAILVATAEEAAKTKNLRAAHTPAHPFGIGGVGGGFGGGVGGVGVCVGGVGGVGGIGGGVGVGGVGGGVGGVQQAAVLDINTFTPPSSLTELISKLTKYYTNQIFDLLCDLRKKKQSFKFLQRSGRPLNKEQKKIIVIEKKVQVFISQFICLSRVYTKEKIEKIEKNILVNQTCYICKSMVNRSTGKAIPCGHLFCGDCFKVYHHASVLYRIGLNQWNPNHIDIRNTIPMGRRGRVAVPCPVCYSLFQDFCSLSLLDQFKNIAINNIKSTLKDVDIFLDSPLLRYNLISFTPPSSNNNNNNNNNNIDNNNDKNTATDENNNEKVDDNDDNNVEGNDEIIIEENENEDKNNNGDIDQNDNKNSNNNNTNYIINNVNNNNNININVNNNNIYNGNVPHNVYNINNFAYRNINNNVFGNINNNRALSNKILTNLTAEREKEIIRIVLLTHQGYSPPKQLPLFYKPITEHVSKKRKISKNDLSIINVIDQGDDRDRDHSSLINNMPEMFGSKLSAILKYVFETILSDHSIKIIIFSKYDFLLKRLGALLDLLFADYKRENKIPILYVTCRGNTLNRKKSLDFFKSTDRSSPKILFLSLTNAASGTHLTKWGIVATHIVLVDPVSGSKEDAMSTDAQAIARSYRIGQDQSVVVTRFIVQNTIDADDFHSVYQ